MTLNAMTVKGLAKSRLQDGAKGISKKHLLIAFAFASEWALAFAFARRFANAFADANYAFAQDDYAGVPRLRELHARVARLEAEHGRPRSAVDDITRWGSTVDG